MFFFKLCRNWFHVSPSKNNVEAAQMQVARMQKMIHQTELGTSCIWSTGWGHGSSNSPVSSLLPSKRPGRFQEVRKRLRKMTLISSFLPMKSISFPRSRWSRARPKLLALLDWIISVLHSTAQSLCSHLTGIIYSGWILHEFRQLDFHSHMD